MELHEYEVAEQGLAARTDGKMLEKKSQKKITRKRGRPVAGPDAQEQILDAAEHFFAEASYDAVSQRRVASRANVDQALLNYYFGSKEGLYNAVVRRYGEEIVVSWEKGLDLLLSSPEGPTVESLLRSYIAPFFVYRKQPELRVLKLNARLHSETKPFFLNIRREIYDEMTRRYIDELIKVSPGVDPSDITWRLAFAIGALLYIGPGNDRLDDLSEGAYRIDSPEEAVNRLTAFLVGGFSAASTFPPQGFQDNG